MEHRPEDTSNSANSPQWEHVVGSEYLAANPVDIPGLSCLLDYNGFHRGRALSIDGICHAVFSRELGSGPCDPKKDPFEDFPVELRITILEELRSKDIANLRLASKAFRPLPLSLFRKLLLQDMPWMWEIDEMPIARKMDWYDFYMKCKFGWSRLKGLQNRRRIWLLMEGIVEKIQMWEEDAKELREWVAARPS